MASGACAGCSSPVALIHARPVVGGDGRVALWCRTCFARRDELVAAAARALPSTAASSTGASPSGSGGDSAPPRHRRRAARPRTVSAIEMPDTARRRSGSRAIGAAIAATAAAVIAVAVVGTSSTATPPAPISPAASVIASPSPAAPPAPVEPPAAVTPPAAVEPPPADEPHVATDEGTADPDAPLSSDPGAIDLVALEEERPSLRDWIHPVTGTDEPVPVRSTRKYGAKREGLSRTLCGAGHCGVDLSGPRGRPVVAVAWGTVVRVEHSARGRDGRSGRYVRLEHPEGVFTSYMHLDAIEAEISVGDEVEAGTVLGTLGKTAIYHGEQHLHFGLEVDDHGALVYIDPTPFLARAQVAPIPDRPLTLLPPDEREQW